MCENFEGRHSRSSDTTIRAEILRRPDSPSHASSATVERDGTTIVVPAEVIAAGLGLSTEAFLAELRAGLVYETTEKGTAEDSGRFRLTFRFRSRQFRLLIDETGQLLTTD